jgi:acyl-CoA reductase-like NAD-dependent aldehyde dehydrogenase
MQHTNLYIDGQWRDAASGERFDVINPATEETIASVASADLADADAALDAAEAAFRTMGREEAARTLGNPAQGVGTDDRTARRICAADHA